MQNVTAISYIRLASAFAAALLASALFFGAAQSALADGEEGWGGDFSLDTGGTGGDFSLGGSWGGSFPLDGGWGGDFALNSGGYGGDFVLGSGWGGDFALDSGYGGDFGLTSGYGGSYSTGYSPSYSGGSSYSSGGGYRPISYGSIGFIPGNVWGGGSSYGGGYSYGGGSGSNSNYNYNVNTNTNTNDIDIDVDVDVDFPDYPRTTYNTPIYDYCSNITGVQYSVPSGYYTSNGYCYHNTPTYTYTPYVSLSQVPYTGFELSPAQTALYYSFLVLWCLVAAYLIVVKRVQVTLFSRLNSFLFGSAAVTTGSNASQVNVAGASLKTATRSEASAADATDEFIRAQISRPLK